MFGRSAPAEMFAERPWLLNESPNDARAGEFGMTLDEYSRAWVAAADQERAGRTHAANMREIASIKSGIRAARHAERHARILAESGTLESRKRLLDAEHEVEHAQDRLLYMVRGLSKSAQREHLADVGIEA